MRLNRGMEKRFFPPTKDIGTIVGDRLDKGKYFPLLLSGEKRENSGHPIPHTYSDRSGGKKVLAQPWRILFCKFSRNLG